MGGNPPAAMKNRLVAGLLFITLHALAQDDPYLWLEDVTAPKALEWVKANPYRGKLSQAA